MLAFESARSAVRAAVDIQKATLESRYSLRIGVHTGEVQQTASDIYGLTVNKAARVAAAGGAGEVIVSSITRELIGTMDTVKFGEPRAVSLKGFAEANRVVSVLWT